MSGGGKDLFEKALRSHLGKKDKATPQRKVSVMVRESAETQRSVSSRQGKSNLTILNSFEQF